MRTIPLLLLLFVGPIAFAAPPEVRGTWLTTTANEALDTPAHTADAMKQLRAIGLNVVYVECWKNGHTQFPSNTLEKAIATKHPSTTPAPAKSRDLLLETVIEAHRNQLLHIAWFEYGFEAASKDSQNELRTARPQWLLRNREGSEIAPDGTVWLNPSHPEVGSFLINLMVEAAINYDIDGVQLDDRLAWPDLSMGYDDYTKNAYAKDHNGSGPPDEIDNAEWVRWRTEKVTEFAGQFYAEMRKVRPSLLISVSPSPYPWSQDHHAVEWPIWMKKNWMDEFVPQVYRDRFATFNTEWSAQLDAVTGRRQDLIAGLRIVGTGADTPWDDLRQMLERTRQTGAGGHCWWFSRGVLEVYQDQIAAYYDVPGQGLAPHPKRDEKWRPPPIVAEKRGQHWSVRVDEPGSYLIVAQKDGVWSVLRTVQATRGVIEIIDKHYDTVELLVDHRRS